MRSLMCSSLRRATRPTQTLVKGVTHETHQAYGTSRGLCHAPITKTTRRISQREFNREELQVMRPQVSMAAGKIMRKSVIITVSSALCIALGAAMLSNAVAQDVEEAPSPNYNPYPPGILPADLNLEILRVQ